jgi:hypothetical protein
MLWSFIKMMVKCDMSGKLVYPLFYYSDKHVSARFTNMGFPQDSSYLDVEDVIY